MDFQSVLQLAMKLPPGEREHLARALGAQQGSGSDLPLFTGPRPQSAAWVRAERGHAVLATGALEEERNAPAGAAAIAGMWEGRVERPAGTDGPGAAAPNAGPALVATDVCVDLPAGLQPAREIFARGAVEVRLATATYLELLAWATSSPERQRIQRFVRPYAVLTLGPLASSRSVELLLQHREAGLEPLQALTAATALAHEIPLITREPKPFAGIAGLQLVAPY